MTLVATALCAEMNRVSGTGSFHDCERLAETAIKTISTYQATGRSGAGAVEKTRGALLRGAGLINAPSPMDQPAVFWQVAPLANGPARQN